MTAPASIGETGSARSSAATSGRAVGAVRALLLLAIVGAALVTVPSGSSVPAGEATARACADPCGITVLKQGSGRVTSSPPGIDCGSVCSGPFIFEQVALRADPAPRGWSGCDMTLPDGTCSVYVDTWMCVTAIFALEAPPPDPALCTPYAGGGAGTGGGGGPTVDPYVRWGARCTIRGTRRGETLRGTVVSDVICGYGGNDRIYGGGGNDVLRGGDGNDRLYGQDARDRLDGGRGDDTLAGGARDDEHRAGAGADTLLARDGTRDVVDGGRGRDRARIDLADVIRAIERRF